MLEEVDVARKEAKNAQKAQERPDKKLAEQSQAKEALQAKALIPVAGLVPREDKEEQVVYASPFADPKEGKKAIASKDPAVLQFLRLVAEGEQDQAESMLKKNPHLALASGSVTDLSKRLFSNITGFQYALWAMDWHMWRMIVRYLPREEAAMQLEVLEENGTEHGQHFNLNVLIEALEDYIKNYEAWYKANAWEKMEAHWCQEVGGAQLLLPAHIINEYCRPDRSFDPCPSFTEETLPRTRNFHSGDKDEWFSIIEYGGRLGVKFAGYRAGLRGVWATVGVGPSRNGGNKPHTTWCQIFEPDRQSMQSLLKTRQQQLLILKEELRELPNPEMAEEDLERALLKSGL